MGAAHPRSRGEHLAFLELREPYPGSSPLARGTQVREKLPWLHPRLIPARAGNTGVEFLRRSVISAHPRSRGEHTEAPRPPCRCAGSSPLARGTSSASASSSASARLIPARAGNTLDALPALVFIAAHPRSRGEHAARRVSSLGTPGSSPLARGTHNRLEKISRLARLIPARAGNT